MQSKGCALVMHAHLSLSAALTAFHILFRLTPPQSSAPSQVVTQHDMCLCDVNLNFAPLNLETKNTWIKQKNIKHIFLNRIWPLQKLNK